MTNLQEIWKDIAGYEGLYQISNLGRVKALEKISINKRQNAKRHRPEKIHLQANDWHYQFVNLYKNGKGQRFKVHRLVAMGFIPNPENKKCVNHIDGNKVNNHASNLEWCTHSENTKHSFKIGLQLPQREKAIIQYNYKSGEFIKKHVSTSSAARELGLRIPRIHFVLKGRRNHVHGFKFKYEV